MQSEQFAELHYYLWSQSTVHQRYRPTDRLVDGRTNDIL